MHNSNVTNLTGTWYLLQNILCCLYLFFWREVQKTCLISIDLEIVRIMISGRSRLTIHPNVLYIRGVNWAGSFIKAKHYVLPCQQCCKHLLNFLVDVFPFASNKARRLAGTTPMLLDFTARFPLDVFTHHQDKD